MLTFLSDIDECEAKKHNCSHTCHNMRSSFTCMCPPGLELGPDLMTCRGAQRIIQSVCLRSWKVTKSFWGLHVGLAEVVRAHADTHVRTHTRTHMHAHTCTHTHIHTHTQKSYHRIGNMRGSTETMPSEQFSLRRRRPSHHGLLKNICRCFCAFSCRFRSQKHELPVTTDS